VDTKNGRKVFKQLGQFPVPVGRDVRAGDLRDMIWKVQVVVERSGRDRYQDDAVQSRYKCIATITKQSTYIATITK